MYIVPNICLLMYLPIVHFIQKRNGFKFLMLCIKTNWEQTDTIVYCLSSQTHLTLNIYNIKY